MISCTLYPQKRMYTYQSQHILLLRSSIFSLQDAAAFVHACGQNFSSQIKLAFYAFYKQATEGPCTANPPPLYDMVGRAKWRAQWRLSRSAASPAVTPYSVAMCRPLHSASNA